MIQTIGDLKDRLEKIDNRKELVFTSPTRGVFSLDHIVDCEQDAAALLCLTDVGDLPHPARRIGTCCMIFCQQCVLLGWHHARQGWEFPGGALEGNETTEEAVRREIAEETGLELPRLWSVGFDERQDGWLNMVFATVLAKFVAAPPTADGRHREWLWFPVVRLPSPLTAVTESLVYAGYFDKAAAESRR